MNEDKKFKIGQQLLGIEDITGTFKKDNDIWKFEIPTPFVKREIEKLIAGKIGCPPENYDKDTYALVKACTYLDNVLIQKPDWWENSEEVRDENLIFDVYFAYLEFERNFRGSLKRGKYRRNSPDTGS